MMSNFNHLKLLKILPEAALSGTTVSPWETGELVAELQRLLNAHGFKLRVDGDFGGRTESAVRAFQQQYKPLLICNGIVDNKTWAVLKATVQPGTRILQKGHTGSDVYELQGLLQVCGYLIKRDGILGEETYQAILDFQKKHKLLDNGSVDCNTWMVLTGRANALPPQPQKTGWFIDRQKWW